MADKSPSIQVLDGTAVGVRVKIAGLWTSLLFVFAYVDIFGLLRADVVKGVLAGKVQVFTVDQTFFVSDHALRHHPKCDDLSVFGARAKTQPLGKHRDCPVLCSHHCGQLY